MSCNKTKIDIYLNCWNNTTTVNNNDTESSNVKIKLRKNVSLQQ